jgi:hypothetical protein
VLTAVVDVVEAVAAAAVGVGEEVLVVSTRR